MAFLRRRSLPLLIGLALCATMPAAASAADRYVSKSGDDTTNTCLSQANPCLTIGHAVGQAASGDTIRIAAGIYGGAGNTGITISTEKNLSFVGAGSARTMLTGGGTDFLFLYDTWQIGATTITASFSDLALQNAHGNGGAAVRAAQDVAFTLNLTRVRVSGNSVPPGYDGGAIQARNGDVSICDSTFTGNVAWVGGAIAAERVTIGNCPSSPQGTPAATFTGNATPGGGYGGGAIYATAVTAENAVFDGNIAGGSDGGGAILIATGSAEATALHLSNVTFTDNLAGAGGALQVGSTGDVVISDSTFDNNDATSSGGGALRTGGGDVSITRTSIRGSDAASAAAGDVHNASLTVDDSTVSGNTALTHAGFRVGGDITITNSTLTGNTATSNTLLYADAAIRLRSVTSAGNPVVSNHFFGNSLDIDNSVIDESGSLVCAFSPNVSGSGNVLTDTVSSDCDGAAGPTPTSRVTAASLNLGELADNGGPTNTMALGHGSSALGVAGASRACPATDQRGEERPSPRCDAGAFERPSFTLAVTTSGAGSGTVTGAATDSTPGAIDCAATCSEEFDQDTPVQLTATAAAGSVFTGWGGACAGASPTCTVTMDAAASVTATFDRAPPSAGEASPASTPPASAAPTPTPAQVPTRRPSNSLTIHRTAPRGSAIVTRLVVGSRGQLEQQGTFAPRRPGTVSIATACRADRRTPRAGEYVMTCTLSATARNRLRRGPLRVSLRTTFTPMGGGPRTTTRTITVPARGKTGVVARGVQTARVR